MTLLPTDRAKVVQSNSLGLPIRSSRPGSRCFVIAEVAQAHDGSLGMAHAFIDAIANAGADAVKFQTHIASAESTPGEPWRIQFSRQDASRYEYWKRMEFTKEQWIGLRRHARERGLAFLSSPFSQQAVNLLNEVGVDAWKVPSGEVNNADMLAGMARTRLPVLVSTGMNYLHEIDEAVELIKSHGAPLAVLQCTSEYPCPPEKVGLNLVTLFRQRYGCAVGLSDHSGTIYPGLAAAMLGIDVLEVHVIFSKDMFGPDVPASITFSELRQLVEGIRFIEVMTQRPLEKDRVAQDMDQMRKLFTKSIVAIRDLEAGTVLRAEDVTGKKPGTGIPVRRLPEFLGKRLKRTIKANEVLQEADFL